MTELLATYSIGMILIVLITCIPQIIKFVRWIMNIYKAHKQNQQAAFNEGREAQREEDEEDQELQKLSQREDKLEEILKNQEQILENQQKQLNSLIASDNLNIKYTIKRTWEKVVKQRQPIDAYDLSLLEDRFAIYKARGGNSWARDMMNQIRKVATTTTPVDLDDDDEG